MSQPTQEWKTVKHPLKDGFTTAIHLAGGNQKLIAEVRGDSYAKLMTAAPKLLAALERLIYEAEKRAGVPKSEIAIAREAMAAATVQS